MLLLGIDTSGKTASAVLFDTDIEIFIAEISLYKHKTHSQFIIPAIKLILDKAEKSVSDINVIAVANGPGSYTGLRIGVSTVKAMSFALNCKCCGVSTLETLAFNNIAYKGIICAIMKARGNLVYAGIYKSDGYSLDTIDDEMIISHDKLFELLALTGTEVLLCGDAASEFFLNYGSPMLAISPPKGRLQNACGVCLVALSKEFIVADNLEVSYLQI